MAKPASTLAITCRTHTLIDAIRGTTPLDMGGTTSLSCLPRTTDTLMEIVGGSS